MKPFIGLNVDINVQDHFEARVGRRYLDGIHRAGGIAIPLPQMTTADLDQALGLISAMVLIGGLDYSPGLYGEETHPSVSQLHPERQDFDLRLVRLLLLRKIPFLAICGGLQVFNIARGGSLFQDLETHQPGIGATHKPMTTPPVYPLHPVELTPGSRIAGIFARTRLDAVLSSHHQAVKVLGHGLSVSARADDGTIEGIEDAAHPFAVGVQWHPEGTLDTSAPLFQALIDAALVYRQSR